MYECVGECKTCNCLTLLQSAEELEAKRIYEMQKPLSERLKVARSDAFDPLPPQLLRKVSVAVAKSLITVVILQHLYEAYYWNISFRFARVAISVHSIQLLVLYSTSWSNWSLPVLSVDVCRLRR